MSKIPSAQSWRSNSTSEQPEGALGWTIPQYADRWQVSRGCIHNWLKRGELGSVKIGGTRRILPEHDRAFRERHQSEAFA